MSESVESTNSSAESAEVSENVESMDVAEGVSAADAEGDEEIAESNPVEEARKELKRKLKLRVGGKDIEEEVDLDDEESLVRNFQKSKAFDQKAKELAEYKKQTEALIAMLQSDPAGVLSQFGHDVDKFSEEYLLRRIEDLEKSPEQREREELLRTKDELEKKLRSVEEEKQRAQEEALLNEQSQLIENEILTALNSSKTILSVEDPEVIGDIARAMHRAVSAGIVDVSAKDVIPYVEDRYINKLRNRIKYMDDDAVENAFGKDVFERLRKRRVSKKRTETITASQVAKSTGNSQKVEPKSAEKISYRDFFKKF